MLITPSSGSRPSILRVCLTVKDYNNNQQQYVQKNNMQKEEEEKTLEGKINEKIKEKGKIDQLFIIKAVGNKDKDIPVPRSKINIITTLTTLTVLSLRKCNLTTLPKNITSLVNLKYLNLSGNKFHNWPIFITKLVNLETLLLDNNQLEVPPEFQLATLTKLQILNLSNNQLKYMPVEIATLKNLRELYLDGNLLEDIPKQILFLEDSLKNVSLARNSLNEKHTRICEKGNVKRIMKYLKHQKLTLSKEQKVIKKVGEQLIEIKQDEFDDPKYVDRFNTGGLLRRAYLTYSIDLRRYKKQFLPSTIHPHKDIIQTCVVNIDQIEINIGAIYSNNNSGKKEVIIDEDEMENQIGCSPVLKFILSLYNLNLLVVTYSKKNHEHYNVVKRLTRIQNMLKLSFYVINSIEEIASVNINADGNMTRTTSNFDKNDDYYCKFVVFPLRMQVIENDKIKVNKIGNSTNDSTTN